MNTLGSIYITTKDKVSSFLPMGKSKSKQQTLADRFLLEWQGKTEIDPDALLRHSLTYTAQNVPFYRKYFAEHRGKDPLRLEDWPVLSRDHLWNHLSDLQSELPNQWKTWTHASGGSTGKPVSVVHDEFFAAKAAALRRLCSELFFNGPHYNQLILWGGSDDADKPGSVNWRARIKDGLRLKLGLKTTHINTFEYTQQKFEESVRVLQTQKPTFIFGYAGSIYELAKYLDEHSIPVTQPPQMIGTTAQTLHQFMRERIERVFQCRVCDHYGSREVGPIAWQHHSGDMYFPKFFSRVEVVDAEDRPVANGEQGRILVTTLHNFTMPLIRYDIGDLGVPGADVSYQSFPFATLSQITGRSSEEFTNVRGSRICAPFFINLFYYRPWLDQFYIVQRDFDLIEIMYVSKEPSTGIPDKDLEEINARIRTAMTEQCRIIWTKVDEIPTTKAGKRLFIRSEV